MRDHVDAFRDFGDGDLRMISNHDATRYEMEYVRDDLEDAFTAEELNEAHLNLVANQVSSDSFGQAVDHGEMQAQQFFFEDVIAFVFPSSRYDGYLVSFDRNDSIPVTEVVETGVDLLN